MPQGKLNLGRTNKFLLRGFGVRHRSLVKLESRQVKLGPRQVELGSRQVFVDPRQLIAARFGSVLVSGTVLYNTAAAAATFDEGKMNG